MNALALADELIAAEVAMPGEDIDMSAAELQMISSGEAVVNNF